MGKAFRSLGLPNNSSFYTSASTMWHGHAVSLSRVFCHVGILQIILLPSKGKLKTETYTSTFDLLTATPLEYTINNTHADSHFPSFVLIFVLLLLFCCTSVLQVLF